MGETKNAEAADSPSDSDILKEAFGVWGLSVLIIALLGVIAQMVPIIADNLLAFVAATFLYLPAWALWRRRLELHDFGLTAQPVRLGLFYLFLATIISLPPFIFGWSLYQTHVKNKAVDLNLEKMYRFDRILDGRPEFPLDTSKLSVWIEGEYLVLVWPGDGPVEVNIRLGPPERGVPMKQVQGLSISDDGLRFGSRGRLEVKMNGDSTWSRPNAGGLRFSVRQTQSIRIDANHPIATGRWAAASDNPIEEKRTYWWWLLMLVNQLVLVALPEEWFFRGYLQKRFDQVWTPTWRILGTNLGWGWIASSTMFALGHLIHNTSPDRLAVFFPSLLFGWLRARTGSVLAPTIYHAVCNVLAQGLVYTLA
ncbi:MAG: MrtP family glutamic-type intramembrane protease [Myxococcota bacterium]|nr:MrtP family glutamic-type intramembrane protease [Myxococcota bacterium]